MSQGLLKYIRDIERQFERRRGDHIEHVLFPKDRSTTVTCHVSSWYRPMTREFVTALEIQHPLFTHRVEESASTDTPVRGDARVMAYAVPFSYLLETGLLPHDRLYKALNDRGEGISFIRHDRAPQRGVYTGL